MEDNEFVSGLTPDEQGTAFANAVADAGVMSSFQNMTPAQIQQYWNMQAVKYMGPDWDGNNADVYKFISDCGITSDNQVTQEIDTVAISGIGTDDAAPMIFNQEDVISLLCGSDEYSISMSYVLEDRTSELGAVNVWHHVSLTVYRNGELYHEYTKKSFQGVSVGGSSYVVSISSSPLSWHATVESYGSDWINIGVYVDSLDLTIVYRQTEGYLEPQTYHSSLEDPVHFDSLYLNGSPQNGSVTFTMESGGGGGGQSTLAFTAIAGLSGRHCDPLQDSLLYHPISRSEVPSYGSGGYGGHGGGGGAGAATVVIRKFSTAKADRVEQIAIPMRHGYGSGGGKGGKGGDGCIIIFW